MSVNSSSSPCRLTRGSYTSYFTLQISNNLGLKVMNWLAVSRPELLNFRATVRTQETVRESERDNFEYYLFVTVGDCPRSGLDNNNLRGLLWLSLDNADNAFTPEAAARAAPRKGGNDGSETDDATDNDTRDGTTVGLAAIALARRGRRGRGRRGRGGAPGSRCTAPGRCGEHGRAIGVHRRAVIVGRALARAGVGHGA